MTQLPAVPLTPHVEVAADSDTGLVRRNNEDRYAVAVLDCGGQPGLLALVADGVGGHLAGEVAAQTVVDWMVQEISASPCADPRHALPRAAIQGGREVYRLSQEKDDFRGMGTTVAAVWLVGDRLYTVTVGDSRIYLRHKGRLVQANVDHTWVQEAVEIGLLTPDQARVHPNAHVLRRHLGSATDPQPDLRLRVDSGDGIVVAEDQQGLALEPGDAVVLCSDGLTDLVTSAEIGAALARPRLNEAVHGMIELARSRGGHDNITVVALRMPRAASASPRTSRLKRTLLTIAVLAAVALAAAGGIALAVLWPR